MRGREARGERGKGEGEREACRGYKYRHGHIEKEVEIYFSFAETLTSNLEASGEKRRFYNGLINIFFLRG